MKLKQRPEDFRVEELTDAAPQESGEFALYRLDKTGWTTPDALAAVRRRWQIDWQRPRHRGPKEPPPRPPPVFPHPPRAVTPHFFPISPGPKRALRHEPIGVPSLGQRREPFGSADIRANRFTIT